MVCIREVQVKTAFRKTHSFSWYKKKLGTFQLWHHWNHGPSYQRHRGQSLWFRKRKAEEWESDRSNLGCGVLYKVTSSLWSLCGVSSQSSSKNLVEDVVPRVSGGSAQCASRKQRDALLPAHFLLHILSVTPVCKRCCPRSSLVFPLI